MTTDAKLILESICVGYALCSSAARKAMKDALPAHGWEGVTQELFENIDMHALFIESIRKRMQIPMQPDSETSSPMAFIVAILKQMNAEYRTKRMKLYLSDFLNGSTVKDLDTLIQMREIARSQGNGTAQEATTGPAHSVSAPQPVAHGAGDGKAPTPNAGQRKE